MRFLALLGLFGAAWGAQATFHHTSVVVDDASLQDVKLSENTIVSGSAEDADATSATGVNVRICPGFGEVWCVLGLVS